MISLMKGFWKVEFEIKTDRVFTLKTQQMFSNHTTPEKFENVTIIGHFGFLSEEHSGSRGRHMTIRRNTGVLLRNIIVL